MKTPNKKQETAGQHTPGPWKLTSRNGIPCILPNDGDREYLIGNKSNARLIAAAPDLLAALQDAVNDLAMSEGAFVCEGRTRTSNGWERRLAAARAAIAKATGGDK